MNKDFPEKPDWFKARSREYCKNCGKEVKTDKNTAYCSSRCKHLSEIRDLTEDKHYTRDSKYPEHDPSQPLRRIHRCLWCKKETFNIFCIPDHEEQYDIERASLNRGKTYSQYLEEKGLPTISIDF